MKSSLTYPRPLLPSPTFLYLYPTYPYPRYPLPYPPQSFLLIFSLNRFILLLFSFLSLSPSLSLSLSLSPLFYLLPALCSISHLSALSSYFSPLFYLLSSPSFLTPLSLSLPPSPSPFLLFSFAPCLLFSSLLFSLPLPLARSLSLLLACWLGCTAFGVEAGLPFLRASATPSVHVWFYW